MCHSHHDCSISIFSIRLTHANVCKSMGKPSSCMQFIKSRIFYYKSRENPYHYCKSRENPYHYCKSRENPYQVLQVTWTDATSERAMKSKVRMIKSYYHHSTKLYRDICCHWHCYSCCTLVTIQTATNS